MVAGEGDTLAADFLGKERGEALGAQRLRKRLDISKEAVSLQLQRARHKNLCIYSEKVP